ncbi:beta strand repeat-containing protein [Prosthecobacter dejongeii]|uniref:Glycine-rich domain-containing protein n=1 Tax=Prosthecobacter dejongeii TaxID=48465 RepID=A0A7W7YJP0_9BACT|nr:hypothetical protein [Prosthecobacter dejongeii]MBB5037110.1 hypothetical protein [Prosthecobacter dejongeii]
MKKHLKSFLALALGMFNTLALAQSSGLALDRYVGTSFIEVRLPAVPNSILAFDSNGIPITAALTTGLSVSSGQLILSPAWSQLSGVPSTFTPSAHSHIIGDVTGLQAALDGKLATSAISAFGLTLVDDLSASAARTTLGLGTLAAANSLAFADLTSKPTTLAGYGITDPIVLTSGSYANPSWLASLAWSKITGAPTTLAGYGITDPIVLTSGSYANPAWLTSLAWSKLTGVPSTFAPSAHAHIIGDVTGLQSALDGKLANSAVSAFGLTLVDDLSASAARATLGLGTLAVANSLAFADLTSKPTTLAGYGITDPIVLTSGSYANPSWLASLAWSKITGAPTSLAGYGITDPVVLTSGSYGNPAWLTSLAWSKLTGVPSTFAPSGHSHIIGDVTGLQSALDGKLASSAVSAFGLTLVDDLSASAAQSTLGLVIGSQVQAYDLDLDDLADGSLTGSKVGSGISASNITSGTLPVARIGTGDIGATQIASTSVTPGSYTSANITVDADGRITSANNGSPGGITALTGDVTASGSGSVAATLAPTGVTAGAYPIAGFTVDSKGRLSDVTPYLLDYANGVPLMTPAINPPGAYGVRFWFNPDWPDEPPFSYSHVHLLADPYSEDGAAILLPRKAGRLLLGPSTYGSDGDVVVSNGDGTTRYEAIGGGTGTVTYVDASGGSTGFTFTGVPVTGSGTLVLAVNNAATVRSSIGVAIGSQVQAYDADLDDLADGSLTGSKVGTGISASNITSGTLPVARIGTGDIGATQIASTAVTPGSYTMSNVTVDADGRITAAGNGSAVQVDIYDGSILTAGAGPTTTTWNKPAGCKAIEVYMIGGGGSGGSGRQGAGSTVRGGGGGGAAGARVHVILDPAEVPSSVTVSYAGRRLGGQAVTLASTNGDAGTNGVASSFGNWTAVGGAGGSAGTTATVTGGAAVPDSCAAMGVTTANLGGGSGGTGGGTAGASGFGVLPTGGGGGGGITSANAQSVGLAGGGASGIYTQAGAAAATAGTAIGYIGLGGGGGGGGTNAGGAAQSGADGANYGGGGGGGGGSVNTISSGAGGRGGAGLVIVRSYF